MYNLMYNAHQYICIHTISHQTVDVQLYISISYVLQLYLDIYMYVQSLYYDAYVQSYISIYSDCVISTTVHQCIICIGTMCILHQAVWYVQLYTRIPINKLTSSVHPLIDIVQWGGHHHYPTVSILFPSFLQVFQEKMG